MDTERKVKAKLELRKSGSSSILLPISFLLPLMRFPMLRPSTGLVFMLRVVLVWMSQLPSSGAHNTNSFLQGYELTQDTEFCYSL